MLTDGENKAGTPKGLIAVPVAVGLATVDIGWGLWEPRGARLVAPWQASQYWVTYDYGLVRRGLPGTALALATGGAPSMFSVTVTAIALFLAAVLALTVLVVEYWGMTSPFWRPWAIAVVGASPFTYSLLIPEIGGYDAIGVAAVAMFVLVSRYDRITSWGWLALLSTASVIAAASEEFLVAYLVPVAVACLASSGLRVRAVASRLVLVLGPALAVTVTSLATAPTRAALAAEADAAQWAGSGITGLNPYQPNAIVALTETVGDAIRQTARINPASLVSCLVLWGGLWAISTAMLWLLSGRRGGARFWWYASGCAVVAVSLSAIGLDYRRWWAFAFMAGLAVLLRMPAGDRPPSLSRGPLRAVTAVGAVAFLLVTSLASQPLPAYPSWDPSQQAVPAPGPPR